MRCAAEIGEIPGLVHCDFIHTGADKVRIAKVRDSRGAARFEIVKQFDLEGLLHFPEHLSRAVQRHIRPFEAKVLLYFVAHPLFDRLQVFRGERAAQVDVVKKTVFNDRPNAELCLWK
jgi:hypothetical protein